MKKFLTFIKESNIATQLDYGRCIFFNGDLWHLKNLKGNSTTEKFEKTLREYVHSNTPLPGINIAETHLFKSETESYIGSKIYPGAKSLDKIRAAGTEIDIALTPEYVIKSALSDYVFDFNDWHWGNYCYNTETKFFYEIDKEPPRLIDNTNFNLQPETILFNNPIYKLFFPAIDDTSSFQSLVSSIESHGNYIIQLINGFSRFTFSVDGKNFFNITQEDEQKIIEIVKKFKDLIHIQINKLKNYVFSN